MPPSLSQHRYGAGAQEPSVTDEEISQSGSAAAAALQSEPAAAGTFSSFIRKKLSWPLSVTRAVCNAPWYVSRRARHAAQALVGHLRDNAQDYTFLYELLSMSLPLLFVLHEVLLQMCTEAVPGAPSAFQHLLPWLQEQIGHRLI